MAVGSRRRRRAEAFGERFGVPNRHDSYEALVADPEVDVVYVGRRTRCTTSDALLALRAGKHVLVREAVHDERGRGGGARRRGARSAGSS